MNTHATDRIPYATNTATLPEKDVENGRNYSDKKEQINEKRVVVFNPAKRKPESAYASDSGFSEPITARWWMGRSPASSVVYCSIWISTLSGRYLAGHGSAGGGGYHKESAALEEAISSAGIKLAGHIGGCGDSAMEHALRAIARAAGYENLPFAVL